MCGYVACIKGMKNAHKFYLEILMGRDCVEDVSIHERTLSTRKVHYCMDYSAMIWFMEGLFLTW
jgi:hypothetical protein